MRLRRANAGFTLIEMIAVVVILSILIVILVPKLMGGGDTVRAGNTRAFLASLASKIAEYEQEQGDWPKSSAATAMDLPNKLNLGSELLVVALYAPERPDPGLPDERLCNTDADKSRKSLTRLASADLFEIADDWGNPVAYVHRVDYGTPMDYQTLSADGSEWVQSVKALKNPRTEDYYNRAGFQLISAGPDGEFGTKDDIGNFNQEEP